MDKKDFDKVFTSASPPWLHLIATSSWKFANWSAQWTNIRKGTPVQIIAHTIRGKKCSTKQSLFDEFGAVLQFPYYFGENWDTFEECLADLEWLSAEAYLLFIPDAEYLLADFPEDFRTFIDILQSVALERAGREPPVPFHPVLQCEPESKERLVSKLQETGADFSVYSLTDPGE